MSRLKGTEKVNYVASTTFIIDRKYSDLKLIGKGSYGIVVSALDMSQGKKVAIKKITPMAKHVEDAKHVLREIRLMRHMGKHENIISIYDLIVREQADELYIVMELLDSDLHRVIQSKQPLSDNHFRYFVFQLLCGVKYLHDNHIIHRDLKPGNLLVTKDCKLRITDFGLARERPSGKNSNDQEDSLDSPMTEHVVTRWYRPPELMLCPDGLYSYSVDMWSCGCILGEMLGRNPMFPGKNFIHQLSLIFDVIGSPLSSEISHIKNSQARKFLDSQIAKRKVPFSRLFPDSSSEALDLLEKLLVFEPSRRINANEALLCKYVNSLTKNSPSMIFPPVSSEFEFEFEQNNSSRLQLRALIVNESLLLRRERKGEIEEQNKKEEYDKEYLEQSSTKMAEESRSKISSSFGNSGSSKTGSIPSSSALSGSQNRASETTKQSNDRNQTDYTPTAFKESSATTSNYYWSTEKIVSQEAMIANQFSAYKRPNDFISKKDPSETVSVSSISQYSNTVGIFAQSDTVPKNPVASAVPGSSSSTLGTFASALPYSSLSMGNGRSDDMINRMESMGISKGSDKKFVDPSDEVLNNIRPPVVPMSPKKSIRVEDCEESPINFSPKHNQPISSQGIASTTSYDDSARNSGSLPVKSLRYPENNLRSGLFPGSSSVGINSGVGGIGASPFPDMKDVRNVYGNSGASSSLLEKAMGTIGNSSSLMYGAEMEESESSSGGSDNETIDHKFQRVGYDNNNNKNNNSNRSSNPTNPVVTSQAKRKSIGDERTLPRPPLPHATTSGTTGKSINNSNSNVNSANNLSTNPTTLKPSLSGIPPPPGAQDVAFEQFQETIKQQNNGKSKKATLPKSPKFSKMSWERRNSDASGNWTGTGERLHESSKGMKKSSSKQSSAEMDIPANPSGDSTSRLYRQTASSMARRSSSAPRGGA